VSYDLLARVSAVIEALSVRLLRRRVVIPIVVFFVLTFPLVGNLRWISDIGIVAASLLPALAG
jgi:hypothetical protein